MKRGEPGGISRRVFVKTGGAALAGGAILGAAPQPATVASMAPLFPIPGRGQTKIQRYRTLGRTGWQVSDVSMGTGNTSDFALVRQAIDRGVNYFDTGEFYAGGAAERALGEALQHVEREKVFISCKGLPWGDNGRPSEPTEEAILRTFRGSLERLRTDYVDAYSIYMPRTVEALAHPDFHSAMDRMKAEGRVRFVGASHHGAPPSWGDSMTDVLCAAAEDGRFDTVLMVYNFLNHDETDRVLSTCKANNVGTSAMKTAPGVLHFEPFDPDDLTEDQEQFVEGLIARGSNPEEALERLKANIDRQNDVFERTRPFVERYGVQTEEQLRLGSIHWAIQNPDMHTALVTLSDFDTIDKVLALSGTELSPVEREVLEGFTLALDSQYCRHGCAACSAVCSNEVPVSTIMRYVYYFEGQGRQKHALARYAALGDADAGTCRGCWAPCVEVCPHGIDIPYQMHRAHALLTYP